MSHDLLNVSKFILVDHHIATSIAAIDRVIQIFDHRPLDAKNAQIRTECKLKIQEVGSCATLIADEIRTLGESFAEKEDLIGFLRGPIVLDTINFSETADKARSLDIEINAEIEKSLNLNKEDRLKLFKDLVKARSDVSALSALQLLSKDLKVISNDDKSFVVAIPGFPILVEVKKNHRKNLKIFHKIKEKSFVF